MAQIIMWLLRKVASIAVETVVLDVVAGRTRRALVAPAKEQPVAALPSGQVDPGILLIAERIAAALEEHGLAPQEAILADGRARPNISILVVTHDAAQSGEIVDATVEPADEAQDQGLAA